MLPSMVAVSDLSTYAKIFIRSGCTKFKTTIIELRRSNRQNLRYRISQYAHPVKYERNAEILRLTLLFRLAWSCIYMLCKRHEKSTCDVKFQIYMLRGVPLKSLLPLLITGSSTTHSLFVSFLPQGI